MKAFSVHSAMALSLATVACGGVQTPTQGNAGSAATEATQERDGQVYSATGEVTGIAGGRVIISHGPVEGIGWPAMTMGFRAASLEMVRDISPGDRVSFQFRQAGGDYELTSLAAAQ